MTSPALWCLISAALFGASTPVAKALLEQAGPFSLAGLLYLGAAVGVAPFSFKGGSAERRRHPAHMGYLAGAVVFGGAIGPVLLMLGLMHARAASVSLWLNLETVATAAFAWLFFREHMGARTWLAAGCVVAGGTLLALPFAPTTLTAALLVAGACACWGMDNNLTALIDGYTPAQSTLIKGVAAGSVNLIIGLWLEPFTLDAAGVGGALAVGALSYGVSIMLYISGAHHLGATRSQMLFATAPLWGVVLAWTVFAEPVSLLQAAAVAPMALGVLLLLTGSHAHEHSHERMTHSHSHRHDDDHHDHVHPGLPAWIRKLRKRILLFYFRGWGPESKKVKSVCVRAVCFRHERQGHQVR